MVKRWKLLLKTRKCREKDKLFGKNENFTTTVITSVRSAIKCLPLLLVHIIHIAHHCYPRNGVQERVKYFRKNST